MVNADQEWFYKSPEWEALIEAFDKWNSRVACYRGSREDDQPFVRKPGSEFDEIIGVDEATGEIQTSGEVDEFVYADAVAERLATLLYSVAKIDPMPIWDAYLAVERYEIAAWRGDETLPEPPWHALRRAEVLYQLVWAESRTDTRPNEKAKPGRGKSASVQERLREVARQHLDGLSKKQIAANLRIDTDKVGQDLFAIRNWPDSPLATCECGQCRKAFANRAAKSVE